MKRTAALIAASLAWTGCSVAETERQPAISFGQDFSLRPGESAQTADAALQVGFEAVVSDSRCPKGEQCVWAGQASIRVWLRQRSGQKQMRELRSSPGIAQTVQAGDLVLRLVRLDPYPLSGRAIDGGQYIVTLTLDPPGSPSLDR